MNKLQNDCTGDEIVSCEIEMKGFPIQLATAVIQSTLTNMSRLKLRNRSRKPLEIPVITVTDVEIGCDVAGLVQASVASTPSRSARHAQNKLDNGFITLLVEDEKKRILHFKFAINHSDNFFEMCISHINKPRTAKVGAISKAQNLKGGPFGLCETPAGCKKF